MRRSLFIILAVILASAAIVGFSSQITKRLCTQHLVPPGDDLAWLRLEFRLSDAELARVKQLHDGYLPKCRFFCAQIAVRKRELQAALDAGAADATSVERRLTEIGAIRAQCQSAMLQHFRDVSRVMPPEQGRRYLAEMQRLTLGSHDQFERSMSGDSCCPHGNH
jgi:hypothetical protein